MKASCSLVVLAISAFLAQIGTAEDHVEILRTGLWHGHEVAVDGGPDWWGIFPDGEGYTLQAAPVTITQEHDGIIDNSPDEKTGKKVVVPQEVAPVLLVRGLPDLVPGPLDCLSTRAPHPYTPPGETIYLRKRSIAHRTPLVMTALGEARERPGSPGYFGVFNYRFALHEGHGDDAKVQTLPAVKMVSVDSPPRLVWAGDLDRDGELDLLVDFTYHYNLTHLALFLSTAAKKDEFVGLVAEWKTTGC